MNVNKFNAPQPTDPTGKPDKDSGKPPSYLYRLVAPETLPNTILCIIGIAGVVAAFYTLRAMKEQAELMNGQLKEMEKSREIDAKVLVLQYRPKIIVRDARASDFNVAELGKPAKANVRFTVINVGGTPAHVADGTVALWSVEPLNTIAPIELKCGDEDSIGEFTLQPGESTAFDRPLNTGVTNDIQWANYHQAIQTEPPKYIYLVAVIRYIDDLGIPRQTGISRKYDPKTRTFIPEAKTDQEYAD